jgi:hypothetical protein
VLTVRAVTRWAEHFAGRKVPEIEALVADAAAAEGVPVGAVPWEDDA